jgi:hypothetical protein
MDGEPSASGACGSPSRPVGNSAARQLQPWVDLRVPIAAD